MQRLQLMRDPTFPAFETNRRPSPLVPHNKSAASRCSQNLLLPNDNNDEDCTHPDHSDDQTGCFFVLSKPCSRRVREYFATKRVSDLSVTCHFSLDQSLLLSHVASDPSKARVLYDSKILECRSCKNKRSEYLVHFYGWNSSWDRCVPEENILKDTAENRQLQRQLAEAAAQGIRWKRVKLNKIPAIIREAVLSNSQDGHTSASDAEDDASGSPLDSEDMFENQKRSKSPSTSSLSSHQAKTFSQSSQDSCRLGPDIMTTTVTPAASEQLAWIAFPDNFKSILDADYESVMKKKERHRLPADTVISEILRDFRETVERGEVADLLPNFSRRSGVTRAFTQTNSRSFSDLQQLVDEFVNSVEIYVNSICSTHLFYNESERQDFARHGAKGTECLGLVHLLRFLVILPDFVQATNTITKHQVSHLTSILENFYFFLSKKQHLYLRS